MQVDRWRIFGAGLWPPVFVVVVNDSIMSTFWEGSPGRTRTLLTGRTRTCREWNLCNQVLSFHPAGILGLSLTWLWVIIDRQDPYMVGPMRLWLKIREKSEVKSENMCPVSPWPASTPRPPTPHNYPLRNLTRDISQYKMSYYQICKDEGKYVCIHFHWQILEESTMKNVSREKNVN